MNPDGGKVPCNTFFLFSHVAFLGELNGASGYFPSNFVESI